MIDRAEKTGLGIALGGHVLLVAVLSAGVFAVKAPLPVKRQAVEVQLVDEVGLESGAPQISQAEPAPKLAEVEAPIEAAPPVPQPAPPAAQERPAPPKPSVAPKPAPREAPPKQQRAAGGRLKGILSGLSDSDSDSRATAPPAAKITPAIQSSLAAAIRSQLRPHWSPPSGADAELLRTELGVRLARDGTVTDIQFLRQTGVTASNRAQTSLHKERAIKAVRLASPFRLPPEYYEEWKLLSPLGLDARLAR